MIQQEEDAMRYGVVFLLIGYIEKFKLWQVTPFRLPNKFFTGRKLDLNEVG